MRRSTFLLITAIVIGWQSMAGQTNLIKSFGNPQGQANAMAPVAGGGAIVVGETGFVSGYIGQAHGSTPDHGDIFIVRIDPAGDTLWTKTYGDTGAVRETAYSICPSHDGNFMICAYSARVTGPWLLKIDPDGDTLWTKTYPEVGQAGFVSRDLFSIQPTEDSGYVIACTAMTGMTRNFDIVLLKIDARGNTQWMKRHDLGGSDYVLAVRQTHDGGYILAGAAYRDACLIKTNAVGDTLWTKRYGYELSDIASDVIELPDGGYEAVVYSEELRTPESEITSFVWLWKTNSQGDTLWTKRIDDRYSAIPYSIMPASDGGALAVGEEGAIYKIDENGILQWSRRYRDSVLVKGDSVFPYDSWITSARYRWNEIVESGDGGYLVAGVKFVHSDMFFCLAKTNIRGEITSIAEKAQIVPLQFRLEQNYPNPFNPSTTIEFSVSTNAKVTLAIYDVLGRRVTTLMDDVKHPGRYSVSWNGENQNGLAVPSGVYFYQLRTDGMVQSRTMMLIK